MLRVGRRFDQISPNYQASRRAREQPNKQPYDERSEWSNKPLNVSHTKLRRRNVRDDRKSGAERREERSKEKATGG